MRYCKGPSESNKTRTVLCSGAVKWELRSLMHPVSVKFVASIWNPIYFKGLHSSNRTSPANCKGSANCRLHSWAGDMYSTFTPERLTFYWKHSGKIFNIVYVQVIIGARLQSVLYWIPLFSNWTYYSNSIIPIILKYILILNIPNFIYYLILIIECY